MELNLEQMMCEELNDEIRSLRATNASLESTIKEKDSKINELEKALKDAEKKDKIRTIITQIKGAFIYEDDDTGYYFLDPDKIEKFLYAFIEKYEAM